MQKCPVDMEYLLFAWQDDTPDNIYYLDTVSGAVELVHETLTDIDDLTAQIERDRDRYLFVPKPDRQKARAVLAEFMETVTDASARRVLPLAYESPDPFGGLRKVLASLPSELSRWEDFQKTRVRQQVEEWLSANFLEVCADESPAVIDFQPD